MIQLGVILAILGGFLLLYESAEPQPSWSKKNIPLFGYVGKALALIGISSFILGVLGQSL